MSTDSTAVGAQRFKSVGEDLEHLRDEWSQNPSDAVVRRGSVILRRLLLEGVMQQAWRAVGKTGQPIVVAPNLADLLPADRRRLDTALALGADYGGTYFAAMVNEDVVSSPPGPKAENALEHRFPLNEYPHSLSLWIKGHEVTRREVIRYFAHFEGGAHLQVSKRVRDKEADMVRRIQRLTWKLKVNDKEGLYLELLAIGQALGRSPDSTVLIDLLKAA